MAVDGKALRRALDKGRKDALPYVVSAWAADNGLVLGQVKVDEKSNQITAIPKILCALELSGCIVTIDAMGCQKKIAREIIDADADYVLALKGNHETVHEEVKSCLDSLIAQHQSNPLATPGLDYNEDQNRAREGFAAQNLATLRRLALNVLKRDKSKCSMRLKVKKAGWNHDFLFGLLGITPE